MSKRDKDESGPSPEHPERRSRGEIDRNYFFGDVLIKSGVALTIALGVIALYTPFKLEDAIRDHTGQYMAVMGVFAAISIACFVVGRHLRGEATHWDFD